LDSFLASGEKRRCVIWRCTVLGRFAIARLGSGVWGVLLLCWGLVTKLVEFVGNVFGHGEIHVSLGIVPIELYAAIESTGPIGLDCIVFGEGINEMLGMFVADVFDAKVVND
jgi:hypothetical protein